MIPAAMIVDIAALASAPMEKLSPATPSRKPPLVEHLAVVPDVDPKHRQIGLGVRGVFGW